MVLSVTPGPALIDPPPPDDELVELDAHHVAVVEQALHDRVLGEEPHARAERFRGQSELLERFLIEEVVLAARLVEELRLAPFDVRLVEFIAGFEGLLEHRSREDVADLRAIERRGAPRRRRLHRVVDDRIRLAVHENLRSALLEIVR